MTIYDTSKSIAYIHKYTENHINHDAAIRLLGQSIPVR